MRMPLSHALLRPWQLEDAPALTAAANNRQVWLRLRDRMPHPYTLADAETYLRSVLTETRSMSSLDHSLCIETDGKAAGAIGLHLGADVHRRTAELGYWLAEAHWGRGIVTEAVCAFVLHGFKTLPLDRIYASAYENNPASVRVLEKAGFQFEGRMRKNVIKDGQVLDSLLYAKLRDP